MARSKNYISAITRKMSDVQPSAISIDKLLKASQATSARSLSVSSRSTDATKSSSDSATGKATGIQFGHPSASGTTGSTQSSSIWPNLLKQTASGGLGSILTGGAGIGSLVSGILHLFGGGGKSAPPPLVKFHLPTTQAQTLHVTSTGSSSYSGSTANSGVNPTASPTNSVAGQVTSTEALRYQNAQIAQAVKTALLNSSSLNDVISEL